MSKSCEVLFYSDEADHIFAKEFSDYPAGLAVARETLRNGPQGVFNAFILADGRLKNNLYLTPGGIIVDIGPEPWALSRREAARLEIVKGKIKGLPFYTAE